MISREVFADKLRATLEGEVRFEAAARALYSTDASNYRRVPFGVVIPRHVEDVTRAVALARENNLAVVSRGGGTALAGQATTEGLVIDFSKYMNGIIGIDREARRATVQPGVVQSQLNAAAAEYGLFFPPDPATKDRCTIGGMIGNNSCGAHSAAYGKTVDNVEVLDILLYDDTRLVLEGAGTGAHQQSARGAAVFARLQALQLRYGDLVRQGYPRIPRRVSGYNLDQLLPENGFNLARALVGSEGTLGLILEATVSLAIRPKQTALVALGFEDVFAAADQASWLLEFSPQALEGFDHHLPEFARAKRMDGVKFLPSGRAFLVMEIGGETGEQVRATAEAVKERAKRIAACQGAAVLLEPSEQRAVWSIRESGLGAGAFIPGYPRTWPGAEDCAVSPARLGDFLRRLVPTLARHELAAATYYGHFGEGCVHCRINFDFFTADGVARFRSAMTDLAGLVAEFGGSLSGEHGDGLARSELLPKIFGTELIGVFREFKQIFDPDFRMNPGVIVEPEPLDTHLRFGSLSTPESVRPHFDFRVEGGLAGAALKCVGIGKCRKTDAGTMCPSYMATGEEMHSTRGRARLLYEALNGNLLKEGFADEALYEALELCLSCKACKSECPASIDMSAYRAEFLYHYYQVHRRPLPALFFGRIHDVARAASRMARAGNLFASGPFAGIARRLLGFHPDRRLPEFAAQSFRRWFNRRSIVNVSGPEVVLFPDTFTNFFEPAVAIAATEVIERAGFRVMVPERDFCCGRPMEEAGMLDGMRERLAAVIEALEPYAQRGIPIVGVEPSCLLTLRDEMPSMFPHSTEAKRVAERTMLFDEFVAAQAPDVIPELSGQVLVHGHCHQKALAGMQGELSVLRRAAGLEIEAPDTGCCGMAGAFGYGVNRFELSRKIAERALLPAIRRSALGSWIVADGFACRSQIRQFCPDRRPMHLAEVLRAALPNGAYTNLVTEVDR
jgi:FAD/FMN-containing dehydrogenase/Fe-S oxidoreductase